MQSFRDYNVIVKTMKFLMNRKTTLIFAFSSILSLSTFSQDVLQINNLCKVRQRTKFNSSNTNSYSPNDNILKNHKYDLGEMRKDDLIGVLAFLKNSSKNEIKSIYEFSNTITCAASKTTEVTISYTIIGKATYLQEKNYVLGTIRNVYKIPCQHYEAHWLWRNNEEILTHTIQNFTAYIVKDTYVDVVYYDGAFYSI